MHPINYLLAEYGITVVAVGLTPAGSALRIVGMGLISLCMLKCIPLCMNHMVRAPWAALVGGYSITYVYHYLDVAILSGWDFKKQAPVSGLLKPSERNQIPRQCSKKDGNSISQRILFGLKIASTFRFVGTPYEIRNCPQNTTTTRRRFITTTVGTILVSYMVLDLISSNNDPQIASKYLTMDKIPIFTRPNQITLEELVIRTFTVLAAGISLNCVQGGIYYIFALFAVCLRISEPDDWPPFYGSPREAYTLIRFWK
jgi:hypothetical protein